MSTATLTKVDYKLALATAFAVADRAEPERGVGCCRVYVTVTAEHSRGIAAAAKAMGKIFQKKAYYGLSHALYVGYDNCDGRALARGTAIVTLLKSWGIPAYREECGD